MFSCIFRSSIESYFSSVAVEGLYSRMPQCYSPFGAEGLSALVVYVREVICGSSRGEPMFYVIHSITAGRCL